MIRKVALVQALREAFPSTFGGMYIAEESGYAEPENGQQYFVTREDENHSQFQPKQKKKNHSSSLNKRKEQHDETY